MQPLRSGGSSRKKRLLHPAWVIFLNLIGSTSHADALAQTPAYSIAAIEYAPGPLQKVGKVKAGLLCLPKGTLRWRDIARPVERELMTRLTDTLAKEGLVTAAPPDAMFGDAAPQTTYRIKIIVEELRLTLCVAGFGIGKKPAGTGSVRVRWERYDRVARTRTDSTEYEIPIAADGRDARNTAAVLTDALVESARRYAATRVN